MQSNNIEKDELLWARFKSGDTASFVSLFRNYYGDLFNYGCKIADDHTLIEDCIQDLFIDLWRTNGKADIVSLKAYFFSAFKFKLTRAIAKANKTRTLNSSFDENEFEISHELFMINDQEDQLLKNKVYSAINELSPRQKEIIYLKFHEGLSYEEVSEIMGLNYQASRNLIYQAIKVLKKIITHALVPVILYSLQS